MFQPVFLFLQMCPNSILLSSVQGILLPSKTGAVDHTLAENQTQRPWCPLGFRKPLHVCTRLSFQLRGLVTVPAAWSCVSIISEHRSSAVIGPRRGGPLTQLPLPAGVLTGPTLSFLGRPARRVPCLDHCRAHVNTRSPPGGPHVKGPLDDLQLYICWAIEIWLKSG